MTHSFLFLYHCNNNLVFGFFKVNIFAFVRGKNVFVSLLVCPIIGYSLSLSAALLTISVRGLLSLVVHSVERTE